MNINLGQPGLKWIARSFGLALLLGSVLSTISTAINILPPGVTYIGTVVALFSTPLYWLLSRLKVLVIRKRDGTLLQPFEGSTVAVVVAILVVLWIPHVFEAKRLASTNLLTQREVLELQGPKVYEVYYPQPYASVPNLTFSKRVDNIYFYVDFDIVEQRRDGFKLSVNGTQSSAAIEWIAVGVAWNAK